MYHLASSEVLFIWSRDIFICVIEILPLVCYLGAWYLPKRSAEAQQVQKIDTQVGSNIEMPTWVRRGRYLYRAMDMYTYTSSRLAASSASSLISHQYRLKEVGHQLYVQSE